MNEFMKVFEALPEDMKKPLEGGGILDELSAWWECLKPYVPIVPNGKQCR